MNLAELTAFVLRTENFRDLQSYLDFCSHYLDFAANQLQAVIVCQNEPNYRFFQYRADGHFNITRPLNADLMYSAEHHALIQQQFLFALRALKDEKRLPDESLREIIRRAIYTIQQSIGATLDALPAGQTNIARKRNGDLFERLIRLVLQEMGLDCRTGVVQVPVMVDGTEQFRMSYQHDLLVFQQNELRVIGSVKTSSKDRLDKIFLDKFLYSRLTGGSLPHIAVFLNDVQRKRSARPNEYAVSSTFLPGHFKGYTIKLTPLDGVYYCDMRPAMQADDFLRQHIRPIDSLLCDDLPAFLG